MKQEIKAILQEAIDEMSGFARVRNIMQGGIGNIDTVGILTAENPKGKPASKKFNQAKMAELKTQLRSMGLGFHRIAGKYGSKENSLFVPNITKEQLISLGLEFDQESVIFGEKHETQDGYYMSWSYIAGSSTLQTRDISYSGKDVQDRDDFFSAIKNRKFIIPFFSDADVKTKQVPFPKKSASYQKSVRSDA